MALRALREDVEDQAAAIEHTLAGELFEVAFLAGRQRVVDEDHIRFMRQRFEADLVRLAGTDEVTRIGLLAPTRYGRNRNRAGGNRQLREFTDVFGIERTTKAKAHEHGRARRSWGVRTSVRGFPDSALFLDAGTRTLRAGTTVEIGVLVNHLVDAVLQQHDELIERVDGCPGA